MAGYSNPYAGQPLNALGAIQAGNEMAQQATDMRRQNALAQLYQTQGAGIMNGDPAALNALAAFDPAAAMGIRQQQQEAAFGAEKMQMLRDQTKQNAAEWAMKLSAAEKQQHADTIEKGVAAGLAAKSPEEWDALVTQFGAPDLKGQFGNRVAIAHSLMGVADALKAVQPADPTKGAPNGYMWADPADPRKGVTQIPGMAPDWRAATPAEAAAYGAAGGQINPRTGEFKDIKPPSNGITMTNPDGTQIQIGGNGGGQKLTADQGKNAGYALRMENSQKILDKFEGEGSILAGKLASSLPDVVGNYMKTAEYQQYEQAKRDFVNAALRQESGAVITQAEFQNAEQQYFPQPGDSAEVIAQKRLNREKKLEGMRISAGQQQASQPEQADQPSQDIPQDLKDIWNKY